MLKRPSIVYNYVVHGNVYINDVNICLDEENYPEEIEEKLTEIRKKRYEN